MKIKTISFLMSGLFAAQFASANVEFSSTLTTSGNLAGNYSFYDSGVLDYSYSNWVGNWVPPTISQTSTVLRTYQDAGQWFQDVSVQTLETFTQSTQMQSGQRIDLSYWLNGPVVGDQTISLKGILSGAQGWSASVWASGTPGSIVVGDNEFQVSPMLKVNVDESPLTPYSYTYSNSASESPTLGATPSASWYAYSNSQFGSSGVPINDSFEAKAAAALGGSISGLGVQLMSPVTLGEIQTETFTRDLGTQLVTQAIAAPVPEPETYAMMLAGLGLVGGIARRRKQASAI